MKSSAGLMSQADYARHRKVNRSHISRLAKRGILVMRGKLVDVAASDAVLDDKPVDQVLPEAHAATHTRVAPEMLPPARRRRATSRRLEPPRWCSGPGSASWSSRPRAASSFPPMRSRSSGTPLVRQIRDKLLALPAKLAPQLAALSEAVEIRDLLDVGDHRDSEVDPRGDSLSASLKNASIR